MTPKLDSSYADSVTAVSWWGNHYLQARGLYMNVLPLGNKAGMLGGSDFSPPMLLTTGTSSWRSLSQHSLDEFWASLIFPLHIARLCINKFLTGIECGTDQFGDNVNEKEEGIKYQRHRGQNYLKGSRKDCSRGLGEISDVQNNR